MRSTGKVEEAAFDIVAHGEVPYAAMKSKARSHQQPQAGGPL